MTAGRHLKNKMNSLERKHQNGHAVFGRGSLATNQRLQALLDATPPGLHRVDRWDEMIPVGAELGAETAEMPEEPR